jgi:hypothetical protein
MARQDPDGFTQDMQLKDILLLKFEMLMKVFFKIRNLGKSKSKWFCDARFDILRYFFKSKMFAEKYCTYLLSSPLSSPLLSLWGARLM